MIDLSKILQQQVGLQSDPQIMPLMQLPEDTEENTINSPASLSFQENIKILEQDKVSATTKEPWLLEVQHEAECRENISEALSAVNATGFIPESMELTDVIKSTETTPREIPSFKDIEKERIVFKEVNYELPQHKPICVKDVEALMNSARLEQGDPKESVIPYVKIENKENISIKNERIKYNTSITAEKLENTNNIQQDNIINMTNQEESENYEPNAEQGIEAKPPLQAIKVDNLQLPYQAYYISEPDYKPQAMKLSQALDAEPKELLGKEVRVTHTTRTVNSTESYMKANLEPNAQKQDKELENPPITTSAAVQSDVIIDTVLEKYIAPELPEMVQGTLQNTTIIQEKITKPRGQDDISKRINTEDILPQMKSILHAKLLKNEHENIVIQLEPKELGKMKVSISEVENAIVVNINAEKITTYDVIFNSLIELKEMLQEIYPSDKVFSLNLDLMQQNLAEKENKQESKGSYVPILYQDFFEDVEVVQSHVHAMHNIGPRNSILNIIV